MRCTLFFTLLCIVCSQTFAQQVDELARDPLFNDLVNLVGFNPTSPQRAGQPPRRQRAPPPRRSTSVMPPADQNILIPPPPATQTLPSVGVNLNQAAGRTPASINGAVDGAAAIDVANNPVVNSVDSLLSNAASESSLLAVGDAATKPTPTQSNPSETIQLPSDAALVNQGGRQASTQQLDHRLNDVPTTNNAADKAQLQTKTNPNSPSTQRQLQQQQPQQAKAAADPRCEMCCAAGTGGLGSAACKHAFNGYEAHCCGRAGIDGYQPICCPAGTTCQRVKNDFNCIEVKKAEL